MTSSKLIGAAVALAMFVAVPASAQQAIQEPGAFSFYHPNADVLNGGRTPPVAEFAGPDSGAMAQMQMSVHPRHMRHMMKHN